MGVLSIQTRRIDGLTEATTAEDEDLLLIRKADGTGTRNIKKKNLIPKVVDKVGDLNELTTADKTSVVKAVNKITDELATLSKYVTQTYRNLNRISGENVEDGSRNFSGSHNALYGGSNLGIRISEQQIEEIRRGTFTGMYIGDFWHFLNRTYYIAHFNYFMSDNHVVLIPESAEGDIVYSTNSSNNDVDGGYAHSSIRQYIEGTFKQNIDPGIGKYLKEVSIDVSDKTYPAQAPSPSRITSTQIRTSVCALTQEMLLGFPGRWDGTDDRTCNQGQLALFQHNRHAIRAGKYWLGDLHRSKEAIINEYGVNKTMPTYIKAAVRPIIVVG